VLSVFPERSEAAKSNPNLCLAQPLFDSGAGITFYRLVAGRIKFTDHPIVAGS
jgi:hypothetical protein